MKKHKKIIAAITASAMIATATPATASAQPVQTPIGTIQVPNNIMQSIGPILAAIGGLASIAAIIGSIVGSSNGSSFSPGFIPSTPGNNTPTKPNNPSPQPNPKPQPKPQDNNKTIFGGPKSTTLSDSEIKNIEQQVFNQINYERERKGKHALSWSNSYYNSAKNNSSSMAVKKDISHTSFAGNSEASAIVDSYETSKIANEVVSQWRGSQGHWNLLMSDYSYDGAVGITPTKWSDGEYVYVIVFQG